MTRQKRVFSGRAVKTLCCVIALVSAAFVSGCGPGPGPADATVNYKEVSVCPGTSSGSDGFANAVILVFEITSISNEGSNAGTFNFNPKLLYMNADDSDLNAGGVDHAGTSEQADPGSFPGNGRLNPGSAGLGLARAPFGGFAREQTVAGGSTVTVNAGVVVIEVDTHNGPAMAEMNTTDYHLLYAAPSGSEGVLLMKANGSMTDSQAVAAWGCQHFV
jgi:hypothetical protein